MGPGRSFAVLLSASLLAMAALTPARADFQSCLAQIRPQAIAHGVSGETYDSQLRGMQPNDVLPFEDAQPEFSAPIWDYLAGQVDDERIRDGMAMLQQWQPVFKAVASRFGVDAATVAAVWGIESDYGKGIGRRPVLQSLATLSCDGRRQDYFRTQFVAALKIIQMGDVRPDNFYGSWAGAFGHTQFMPTTFLRFGVGMNDDGHANVVDSVPDALASTANYLRHSGWESGLGWGFEVKLPPGYSGPSGRRFKRSMAEWSSRGLRRTNGAPLSGGARAGLLLPAGPKGPAFLVTENFDVVYAYNNAESYALAISLLSDRLRGGGPIATPWPTDDRGLSRIERRELQTLLMGRGYDIGVADGVMGTKTHAAIVDFETRSGLRQDGQPGGHVLDALRTSR